MSRQLLPLLRSRSIISQNLLSRLMLALVLDCPEDYASHETLFSADARGFFHPEGQIGSDFAPDKRQAEKISHLYTHLWRRLQDKATSPMLAGWDDAQRRLIFTLELVRRVDTVLACLDALTSQWAFKRIQKLFFGNETYALIYLFYLSHHVEPLRRRSQAVRCYLSEHDNSLFSCRPQENTLLITDTLTKMAQDYLHETAQIWRESGYSYTSNCQSLMDNVARTIYAIWGESACTNLLNAFNRHIHGNNAYLFMGRDAFSLECIINVLSRAKGTFDGLLSMQYHLYQRFSDDVLMANAEATRRQPLALGDRDIVSRVTKDKIAHNLRYVDNFVEGSKKIPKYCKQANSKKWALQNIYYYGGHLWMDGDIVIRDVSRFFSLELFGDIDMISAILLSALEIDNDALLCDNGIESLALR